MDQAWTAWLVVEGQSIELNIGTGWNTYSNTHAYVPNLKVKVLNQILGTGKDAPIHLLMPLGSSLQVKVLNQGTHTPTHMLMFLALKVKVLNHILGFKHTHK